MIATWQRWPKDIVFAVENVRPRVRYSYFRPARPHFQSLTQNTEGAIKAQPVLAFVTFFLHFGFCTTRIYIHKYTNAKRSKKFGNIPRYIRSGQSVSQSVGKYTQCSGYQRKYSEMWQHSDVNTFCKMFGRATECQLKRKMDVTCIPCAFRTIGKLS